MFLLDGKKNADKNLVHSFLHRDFRWSCDKPEINNGKNTRFAVTCLSLLFTLPIFKSRFTNNKNIVADLESQILLI